MTAISSLNARDAMLSKLGIGPVWRLRDSDTSPTATQINATTSVLPPVSEMDWTQLQTAVSGCTKCSLCATRTQTVFGNGNTRPQYVLVGDGPNHQDDKEATPFSGRAGQLLDNMMGAIGTTREQAAFSTNLVKCRAVDGAGKDRSPSADEIAACLPYLERQISLLQPRVILALGDTAAITLLALTAEGTSTSASGVHDYQNSTLVRTAHPADLLREPEQKKSVWPDLCLAMDVLRREL